jgi:hypothetical protein
VIYVWLCFFWFSRWPFLSIKTVFDFGSVVAPNFDSWDMGRLFVVHLEGKIYSCKHCRTPLAVFEDIVSKVLFLSFLLWPNCLFISCIVISLCVLIMFEFTVIWQNHDGIVVLLKLRSVVFDKIAVTRCDSVKFTVNPNMYLDRFVI